MSVRVHLDNPHAFYTNLDVITGKVVLSLVNDEAITGIVVKLEGESKTILMRPQPLYEPGSTRREDRARVALEYHKLLYKVQKVFPSAATGGTEGKSYTLRAGLHEYPFRFSIPFNNICHDPKYATAGMSFTGRLGLIDQGNLGSTHVKATLPPSLSSLPGEAEIRYYVKVTVQRPSIFKENRRSAESFKFMPIEPPRPPPSLAEAFARRSHTFKGGNRATIKKGGFLGMGRTHTQASGPPPSVTVDARLPTPSILVCRKPLPLRLIVKKTAESQDHVFITAMSADLVGRTFVRAQDVVREEVMAFPIFATQNIKYKVSEPTDKVGHEHVLDGIAGIQWDRVPLPPTVTPSFVTCNITRKYDLEIKLTLGYGAPGDIAPETVTLPLRFAIDVYSGITPPPQLVAAATAPRPGILSRPTATTTAASEIPPTPIDGAPGLPPRPGAAASPFDPLYPPQMGTVAADHFGEAPPSYEDAIAEDIGPLDGRRPEFSGVAEEGEVRTDQSGAPKGKAPWHIGEGEGGEASGSGRAGRTV